MLEKRTCLSRRGSHRGYVTDDRGDAKADCLHQPLITHCPQPVLSAYSLLCIHLSPGYRNTATRILRRTVGSGKLPLAKFKTYSLPMSPRLLLLLHPPQLQALPLCFLVWTEKQLYEYVAAERLRGLASSYLQGVSQTFCCGRLSRHTIARPQVPNG